MGTPTLRNRYSPFSRQLGIINPRNLRMPICIIGCGSIGSWTTLALAKMGCSNITIIDDDIVNEHNLGSQLFPLSDMGKHKTKSVKHTVSQIVPYANIMAYTVKWKAETFSLHPYAIIISAVDSLAIRKEIYEHLVTLPHFPTFIDGRMGGNIVTVYTNTLPSKHYENTLTGKVAQIPCSQRSVVYNCLIVSGLIADAVAHIANNKTIPFEINMDLTNFELYT